MKKLRILGVVSLSICLSGNALGQTNLPSGQANPTMPTPPNAGAPAPRVCIDCVRAHMEFLASDALRGRGSGTADELVAATYVAAQLRAYGIAPAGDNGSYIQRAALRQTKFSAPPQLTIAKPGAGEEKVTWTYGKEFAALYLSQPHFSGPLRVIHLDDADPQVTGAIVLILGNDRRKLRSEARALAEKGVVAAIIPATAEGAAQFQQHAEALPTLPVKIEGQDASALEPDFNLLEVSPEAAKILEALPENTTLSFDGPSTSEKKYTWNAVGILRGRDPSCKRRRCCSRPISTTWESASR